MALTDRNSGKPWRPEEEKQLKELANGNTPTRLIGLKMGRTPDAIYQKAGELGISLEPHNQRPYNRS